MEIMKNFLIFNYIFLFINILILIKKKLLNFSFKNVDFKLLVFNTFIYKNISDYLNSKYDTKLPIFINITHLKEEEKNNTKKKIRLYFTNYLSTSYQTYQIKKIIEILSLMFEIEIDPDNPDYLFYNVFYCYHMEQKFNNSIKIAYYTENKLPDFNIADYAISQSHINFLDRSFRLPYLIGLNFKNFNNSLFTLIRQYVSRYPRTKFCAAVISNNHSFTRFRLNFIKQLNRYKRVDMGGKFHNNIGKIKNKISFLKNYKFSIAMENSEGDGYISEKIIDSFLSGTIPIYYGDYMIDEYLNPKSYILIRGREDINKKIQFIKKIDKSDYLYKKIIKENVFTDIYFKENIEKQKIEFLTHIFSQDKNKAKRVDNYNWKFNRKMIN